MSAKRQDMLALIAKWFPTRLSAPYVPPGEAKDLLALSGWTKSFADAQAAIRQANLANGEHVPFATSCGDVLKAVLKLWGSSFIGAFGIRDVGADGKSPGAKAHGYYVEADGTNAPSPGDILILRNGAGPGSGGSVGHVGIFVGEEGGHWKTADGGGGVLPDQTAAVTLRAVSYDATHRPILTSPTDQRPKQVDGWIDLDKMPRAHDDASHA